ncbi:acyltransferase family protein [Sphingomonas sp. RS2018]
MTAASPTGNHPHVTIPALDGFRTIAIIVVLCSHVGLKHVVPGQFGVTLFFFLSGYLITTLLRREIDRTGRVSLRRFYLRRTVRILPPMYLTILFFLALSALGLLWPIRLAGLPFDIAFLSNHVSRSGMPIGLWSLAVEEHFYLAFPLLLAALARRMSFRRCAAVCLGLCGVVLVVRVWQAQDAANLREIAVWTHTRVDSILFGAILALWNNPVSDRENILPIGTRGYVLAALLLLPSFAIRDEVFRQTLR